MGGCICDICAIVINTAGEVVFMIWEVIMKGKTKKLISAVLAVMMILATVSIQGSAAAESADSTEQTQYPTFFCHGLMGWGYNDDINDYLQYWGMTSGDILGYLEGEGYEVYDLSVGPISSAWDRACEIYAQIEGLVTDYGEAHCAKANAEYAQIAAERGDSEAAITHERYGRDYTGEAMYPEWSSENKINLVGHSFGGPTC